MVAPLGSGVINGTNGFVYLPTTGLAGVMIEVKGSYAGVFQVQTSPDFETWTAVPNSSLQPVDFSPAWDSGTVGRWTTSVGAKYTRVFAPYLASGSATVNISATASTGIAFGIAGGSVAMNLMTIGDSLTDTNLSSLIPLSGAMSPTTTIGIFGCNMDYLACGFAGNARLVRSAGIFGQTSDQISSRFFTDMCCSGVGLPLGNAVRILAGTNDFLNATNPSPQRTLANIEAMIDIALMRGIFPIVYPIPPRSDIQAQLPAIQAFNQTVNAGLPGLCQRKKCLFVDIYSVLVQPGTGGFIPAMTTDGVHLSNLGQVTAGLKAGNSFRTLPFSQISLGGTNGVPYDPMGQYPINSLCLVSNGLVTVQSADNTFPDTMFQNDNPSNPSGATQHNWVEPGNSPTGFTPYWTEDGNWVHKQVVAGTSSENCQTDIYGAGNPIKYQSNGAYMCPGDIIEISFKFMTANLVNCKVFMKWGQFANSGTQGSPFSIDQNLPQEMIVSNWFMVPPGEVGQLQLAAGLLLLSADGINPYSGDAWAARPTARNLTQLGLVGV